MLIVFICTIMLMLIRQHLVHMHDYCFTSKQMSQQCTSAESKVTSLFAKNMIFFFWSSWQRCKLIHGHGVPTRAWLEHSPLMTVVMAMVMAVNISISVVPIPHV